MNYISMVQNINPTILDIVNVIIRFLFHELRLQITKSLNKYFNR